ncbi:MAG TPA: hypothetical protein VN906_04625 [Candidatus Sulfotelmatobacter sp.]|nr:hypothetical protein [Candidatus Sulfotelmatobacter sp.]
MREAIHARFDKQGNRLPVTGHGCGCKLCAESNAPRYERRTEGLRSEAAAWNPQRRRLVRLVRSLRLLRRPQAA